MSVSTRSLRSMIRATLVAGSLIALSACAANHERAWANGRGMVTSRAYQDAASGDMRVNVHRELMMSANPRREYYADLPYRPFSSWW